MGPGQLLISGVMSILVYAVIAFAVYKIFGIAADLTEIKDILKDIKRNTEDTSPETFAARHPLAQSQAPAQSQANLMRAVSTASYQAPEVESADVPK